MAGARVFNELLKQARREVDDDPVLKSIRFLEEAPDGETTGMSNTLVTTVRALVGQVTLAVAGDSVLPVPDAVQDSRLSRSLVTAAEP